MGAWIEIEVIKEDTTDGLVAPHMGAWIEIGLKGNKSLQLSVAPHMGAWIEITSDSLSMLTPLCRTPHGCVD